MTMIATGYIAAYARRNFIYSTSLEVALWSERGNIGYSFLTRSLLIGRTRDFQKLGPPSHSPSPSTTLVVVVVDEDELNTGQ